ncbi:MAG: helix-turn-helix transcriptional regulator [Selenomonas sp.]|nr:helix-turn-helix transcriptional regulator [Selenomonas sp.]
MEKNFINAQIKTLRKALKLNQAAFGDRIGLKQGAISKMELDGGTVTDQNIKLICEKFNVRREWLTEGTGEMLQETEDTLFAAFAERNHLSLDDQKLARYMLQLTSEERQKVITFILGMAESIRQGRPETQPPAIVPATALPGTLPYSQQEAAEIAAVHEKYRAMREGTAPNAAIMERAQLHQELDAALDEKDTATNSPSGASSEKPA